MTDLINYPPHYKGTRWECIEVIEAYRLGYHLGNAFAYLVRHARKGSPRQDIEKAIWYLERFLASSEAKEAQARAHDTILPVGIPGAHAVTVANSFRLPALAEDAACSILIADTGIPAYIRGVQDAVAVLRYYLANLEPNLGQTVDPSKNANETNDLQED